MHLFLPTTATISKDVQEDAAGHSFSRSGAPTEYTTSTVLHSALNRPYKLAVRRWPRLSPAIVAVDNIDEDQETEVQSGVEAFISVPRATVILQHGGGWHGRYFDQVGSSLSKAGNQAISIDAMGHGPWL